MRNLAEKVVEAISQWFAEKRHEGTNDDRLGTARQAIEFALTIDDHFDMREFLADWLTGVVAASGEYADYHAWLKRKQDEELQEQE